MSSFRVCVLLSCVPAIFASGCIPPDACGGACEANEVCVDGKCFVGCGLNDDCAANELCVNGICVECVNDANCAVNEFCSDGACVNEACLNSRFPCASTADCPVGCNATCTQGVCSD